MKEIPASRRTADSGGSETGISYPLPQWRRETIFGCSAKALAAKPSAKSMCYGIDEPRFAFPSQRTMRRPNLSISREKEVSPGSSQSHAGMRRKTWLDEQIPA
jgi:hypothetical protein